MTNHEPIFKNLSESSPANEIRCTAAVAIRRMMLTAMQHRAATCASFDSMGRLSKARGQEPEPTAKVRGRPMSWWPSEGDWYLLRVQRGDAASKELSANKGI